MVRRSADDAICKHRTLLAALQRTHVTVAGAAGHGIIAGAAVRGLAITPGGAGVRVANFRAGVGGVAGLRPIAGVPVAVDAVAGGIAIGLVFVDGTGFVAAVGIRAAGAAQQRAADGAGIGISSAAAIAPVVGGGAGIRAAAGAHAPVAIRAQGRADGGLATPIDDLADGFGAGDRGTAAGAGRGYHQLASLEETSVYGFQVRHFRHFSGRDR